MAEQARPAPFTSYLLEVAALGGESPMLSTTCPAPTVSPAIGRAIARYGRSRRT